MIIASFKLNVKHIFIIIFAVLSLSLVFKLTIDTSTKSILAKEIKTTSDEQIAQFIESSGWQIDKEKLEKKTIRIPAEFGEVYSQYNFLQKEQGFDLSKYCGKSVVRYSFPVLNYPNKKENIFANVLILDGKIIAADITQTDINGTIEPLL